MGAVQVSLNLFCSFLFGVGGETYLDIASQQTKNIENSYADWLRN